MIKIPHNENIIIKINNQTVAPVIAASVTPPFAYIASDPMDMPHVRRIFENCGLSLGTDVTVTSNDQLKERIAVLPDPIVFHRGQKTSVNEITQALTNYGYTRVNRIEHSGEFSWRGDIIDIYPIEQTAVFRLMFFMDEIEAIKLIDINNFSVISTIPECVIPPIKETCITDNWRTVLQDLAIKTPIIILEEQTQLKIWHHTGDIAKPFKTKKTIEIKIAPVANFFSALSILVPEILWNIKTRGKTVILYTGTSRAAERYLDTKGIQYTVTTPDNIQPNSINIINRFLGISFELVDYNTVVYSLGTPANADTQNSTVYSDDFVLPPEGSLVVHEKHGLGRYVGKKEMNLAETIREYIILQYDGGTFVYIPTDQVNQLFNYNGPQRRLDRI